MLFVRSGMKGWAPHVFGTAGGTAIQPRVAVVGHVEWTTIARSDRVPLAGEVIHADVRWEGPAGGGAVAAVQLARLAGQCSFFTALGDDAAGRRAGEQLSGLGVRVLAAARGERTRHAVSLVDASGERTTTTLGPRLQPDSADPLPWHELSGYDAVFFTAGDTGAVCAARQAKTLVATSRELRIVASARVPVDALAGSLRDPAEHYDPTALIAAPGLLVRTDGADGGTFEVCGGPAARYSAAEPPGPIADLYGVGDTFAAALTFALGAGADVVTALSFAADRGAEATTRTGPYPITAPVA
jgi:ribokinase